MTVSAEQRRLEREPWTGSKRRYDIVKEGTIALIVVAVLTIGLASLLKSPDEPAMTFKGWAQDSASDLYATTVKELAGTSDTATYGPPYNTGGDGVSLGPLKPQLWAGVHQPVDTVNDFVIIPLSTQQQPSGVALALARWKRANSDQQTAWATAYDSALNDPEGADGDPSKVARGDYGPVPTLASGLVAMAASGALDGVLPAPAQFYNTDTTKQIMFMGDGGYLPDAGESNHLAGNQWGMMNGVKNFPGQQWLAPFSFWYQLPVFNASDEATGVTRTLTDNADIYIMAIVGVLSLIVLFLPFIPGLRSIPRWIPIYKLVWRNYYRSAKGR